MAASASGKKTQKYHKCILFSKRLAALVTVSCCLYYSVSFLREYLQYPIVLTMRIETKQLAQFPAVTICNLNRISKQALCEESLDNITAVKDLRNISEVVCYGEEEISGSGSDSIPYYHPVLFSPSVMFDENSPPKAAQVIALYNNLTLEERYSIGHKLEDMLKPCQFHGQQCHTQNFTTFSSAIYGNCFTFQRNDGEKLHSYGKMSGLLLELDVRAEDHVTLGGLLPSVGIRVVVHSPDVIPQPENEGIDISVNYETSLEVKQSTVNRLAFPYADDCQDYSHSEKNGIRNRQDCMRACLQEKAVQYCGCADPTWPLPKSSTGCYLKLESKVSCLHEIRLLVANGTDPCHCNSACKEEEYTVFPSFSTLSAFPTQQSGQRSRLRVYFKTLDKVIYTTYPKYQIQDIFSGLGGQLGLWLGLSLFALIDFISDVIDRAIKKSAIKRKQANEDENHIHFELGNNINEITTT